MNQNILNGLIENREQQRLTPDMVSELITFLNEQGNISREDALKILSNCDDLDGKSKITLLRISDSEIARQINFAELERRALSATCRPRTRSRRSILSCSSAKKLKKKRRRRPQPRSIPGCIGCSAPPRPARRPPPHARPLVRHDGGAPPAAGR